MISDLEPLSTKRGIRGTETAVDTVPQDAFATPEISEEGGEGPTVLAQTLLETGANEMMTDQANAICEETGIARSRIRERHLEMQVGTFTPEMPKMRRGTYFLDGLVERRSRADCTVVCPVAEMHAPGASTRRVGRVLERMNAGWPSRDAVSRNKTNNVQERTNLFCFNWI